MKILKRGCLAELNLNWIELLMLTLQCIQITGDTLSSITSQIMSPQMELEADASL